LTEQASPHDPDSLPHRALGGAVSHDPLVRADLPSGTVTFLLTDVEGSTRLLDELEPDAYAVALADHRLIVREACVSLGGIRREMRSSLRSRARRMRFKRPR
jgi:class 3 adenylate cyclase